MRRGEKNMKKMKKVLAMLLSFIMMMSMAMTTFAASGTNVTLTVTNIQKGQTVYLYKLLNVVKTSETVGSETYDYSLDTNNGTINNALKTVLKIESAQMTAEDVYNSVKSMDKEQLKGLARDLVSQIGVGNATSRMQANGTTAVFDSLPEGYYLIYSPNTVSAIKTVVNGAKNEVAMKSALPTVDKDSDVTPDTGAVVGQVITYTVKTTIPNISGFDRDKYKFTLTDKLSKGLDFVQNLNGKVDVTYSIAGASPEVKGTYEGTLGGENNRTMTVDLKNVVINNQQHEGKELVLTYQAKLNKDAVVENNNEAKIEYSNDPENAQSTTPTVPDKEFTATYELKIKKIASDTKNYLAGAVFELHEGTAEGTPVKVEGDNGKYVYDEDQDGSTIEMTTVADQLVGGAYNLSINGLKAGTYYLVEKTAPDGYNKIEPIKVVITPENAEEGITAGTYKVKVGEKGEEAPNNIIEIVNKKGTLLPETGGMGTVIFTVVAIVLILGVVASFVFSRRRDRR